MWYRDPIMPIIDTNCVETIENHMKSGKINTTRLYGAFQIPLLIHFLMYRNEDIDTLKRLVQLCFDHGADVNRAVFDTDDTWTSALYVIVLLYIGSCDVANNVSDSRKTGLLEIIAILINNGADATLQFPPTEMYPAGESIQSVIHVVRTDPETSGRFDLDDVARLCHLIGI